MKIQPLILLLSCSTLWMSCEDDRELTPPTYVRFEKSSVTFTESSGGGKLYLKFSSPATFSAKVTLFLQSSGPVYSKDFNTSPFCNWLPENEGIPQKGNGTLSIPFKKGDTEVSFTLNIVDNKDLSPPSSITLKIDNSWGDYSALRASSPSTMRITINDDD